MTPEQLQAIAAIRADLRVRAAVARGDTNTSPRVPEVLDAQIDALDALLAELKQAKADAVRTFRREVSDLDVREALALAERCCQYERDLQREREQAGEEPKP